MKLENQRIVIAEACGWTFHPGGDHDPSLPYYQKMKEYAILCWVRPGGNSWQIEQLPDYLNDRNAIHAAIKTLTPCQGITLCIHLNSYGIYGEFDILTASAHDLCQAFLETLGLWKP